MAWYKVASANETHNTSIKKVKAGGKIICLINEHGTWYALGGICPHAGADMSKGWCELGKLICPYHRYSYDLLTGKGSIGQNDYVNAYAVETRADGIYVEVYSFWEKITKALR